MSEHIKRIRTKDGDKQIDYESLANLPPLNPVEKTSAMTQPVGRDPDGRFWTFPSGSGAVYIRVNDNHIQYSTDNSTWVNIISVEDLKGERGDNATSPTVEVSEISGGHRVDITDKTQTHSFNIMDGNPGNTPEKGVDYWTEEDKAEIVEEVLDEIGGGNDGGYAPPEGGIPKNYLASDVQESLGRADSALQPSAQTAKTSAMTQPVGVDESGKLWTSPTVTEGGTGTGSTYYLATDNGISPENSGAENTAALQELVDTVNENGGGTIFFPVGTYEFSKRSGDPIPEAVGKVNYDYAIWVRSGVNIVGESRTGTILKMVGTGFFALFEFYGSEEEPIVGCTYENFTVQGNGLTATGTYDTTGKAFAYHYCKECRWVNLTLINTPSTALGVDFLDCCEIRNVCVFGGGYKWPSNGTGGAGIGIGTGGFASERFLIIGCYVYGCGNFGIFVESQPQMGTSGWGGSHANPEDMMIVNCIAENGRNYGFGFRGGKNMLLQGCKTSGNAAEGVYIDQSIDGLIIDACTIRGNTGNGFANSKPVGSTPQNKKIKNVSILNCDISENGLNGISLYTPGSTNSTSYGMDGVTIRGNNIHDHSNGHGVVVQTIGATHGQALMSGLTIQGNRIVKNGYGLAILRDTTGTCIVDNIIIDNTRGWLRSDVVVTQTNCVIEGNVVDGALNVWCTWAGDLAHNSLARQKYTPIAAIKIPEGYHLDTGVSPDTWEVNYSCDKNLASASGEIQFGAVEVLGGTTYRSHAGIHCGVGTNSYSVNDTDFATSDIAAYTTGQIITFARNASKVSVCAVEKSNASSPCPTAHFYLGMCNDDGANHSYGDAPGYYYSFKGSKNGTEVADFIPVLDVDNTPCMLNKVSGELHYVVDEDGNRAGGYVTFEQLSSALGSYITDVAELIGGDA